MSNFQSGTTAGDMYVPSALPVEMNYSLPASLPSAKNFEIRVQPVNAQSFTAGNVIQIDLPCGRRGQYLDPTTNYIRYKAVYTHGGTAGTDYSVFIGSGYSPFIKQEVYGNNSIVLESINEVGVLVSMLCNCQLTGADKRGLSPAMGFGYAGSADEYSSATAGHYINKTADAAGVLDGLTFEYAMPIIGILGSGTDKMIPIGALYGLRYELTVDNYTNFTKFNIGTNTNVVTGCTISEFEFVGNVIELGPEAQSLIEEANPSKIHIRTNTWRQATNSLAAQLGAGTQDLLVDIRVSSLKSLFMVCSPSSANEGKYAGVNPNLTQGTCLTVAGQNYPQRTMNPAEHPADAYMELQKAFGALSFNQFNGCMGKAGYLVSSTASSRCAAFNATVGATIFTAPNQFYLGIDTEVVARKPNLLSGINVSSAPMFMRCQIANTLANVTHTCNFFGNYDVILELDLASRNITAKY